MSVNFNTSFCAISPTIRLDTLLSLCFPQFSRSLLQGWIKSSQILVNGQEVKPSYSIQGKEEISINGSFATHSADAPQQMPLNIVYEDESLIIINKPPQLVVHPGAGNPTGTLVNGLLAYRLEQEKLPRAGLVHRLDKGTSGLIVAAKNHHSYKLMQELIKERLMKREYIALVEGVPISGDTIERPISRDPRNRLKMRSYPLEKHPPNVKAAITHYRIKHKYTAHCLLKVILETGRTHQIRVHLSAIGYPIVGDNIYGAKRLLPRGCSEELRLQLRTFSRQFLHAAKLQVNIAGKEIIAEAPLDESMQSLLQQLNSNGRENIIDSK